MSKHTLLIVILQLAASGSDAYFTNNNLNHKNIREANPLMRPFVSNTRGRILTFSGQAGFNIAMPVIVRRELHTKNKEKIATILEIEGIVNNTEGVVMSKVLAHPK